VEIEFRGEGVDEKGYVLRSSNPEFAFREGAEIINVDPRYFRPTEVELLIGDPAKAKEKLGWEAKCSLSELVKEMMQADLNAFRREKMLKEAGFTILKQFE